MPKLQEVQSFISEKLPKKLRADLRHHKLVKEADIECASYMHLRRFLDKDSDWTVLARRHIPHTGRYIDLVLFWRHVPRIAIEIKWGAKTIQPKDRSSLSDALTKLGVNKAYWISASGLGHEKQLIQKTGVEKGVLKQIVVRGNFSEDEANTWRSEIPKFRKKMGVGKGRRLTPAPQE